MFDVLTYEKGASVLRMLEQYLGPEVFRAGRARLPARAPVRQRRHRRPVGRARAGLGAADPGRDGRLDLRAGLSARQRRRRGARARAAAAALHLPAGAAALVGRLAGGPGRPRPLAGARAAPPRRPAVATPSSACSSPSPRCGAPLPDGFESVVANEGGHGFYRVRYDGDLRARLLDRLPGLGAIERFNLVNDAWAVTGGRADAGHRLPGADRALPRRARQERVVGAARLLHHAQPPADAGRPAAAGGAGARPRGPGAGRARLDAPARARTSSPASCAATSSARSARSATIRQVQARAAEVYAAHERGTAPVDPNVLPALIAVLAHAGDEARYHEFVERFRTAAHAAGGAALPVCADGLPAAGAGRADAGPHGQRRDPHPGRPVRGALDADARARTRAGVGLRQEAVGHDGPPLPQARPAADGRGRHRAGDAGARGATFTASSRSGASTSAARRSSSTWSSCGSPSRSASARGRRCRRSSPAEGRARAATREIAAGPRVGSAIRGA